MTRRGTTAVTATYVAAETATFVARQPGVVTPLCDDYRTPRYHDNLLARGSSAHDAEDLARCRVVVNEHLRLTVWVTRPRLRPASVSLGRRSDQDFGQLAAIDRFQQVPVESGLPRALVILLLTPSC